MARLLMTRILVAIPLLFGISIIVFLMVDLTPGDPAEVLAGDNPTPDLVASIRSSLGLDRPLPTRYWDWLTGAIHGDLGHSLITREPVSSMISDAAGPTLSLILVTLVFAVIVGGALGILASVARSKILDQIITVVASIAMALPPFWFGMLLALFFAVQHFFFPAIGFEPIGAGFGTWLQYLVLPAIALGALPAAEIALQLKNSMEDTLKRDYMIAARAKGVGPVKLVMKHALKNGSIPVVTVLGTRLAQLIGGTVTVESVFVIPGIGTLAVNSVLARDVPVLLGLVVVTTLVVLVINLAVDLMYSYLNPKVRV